jgi:selenocysteine-specific elongation factor
VITQADLADSDQVTLVGMEIEDIIKPTRFAESPIVAVSSVTGQGLAELKTAIDSMLNTAKPRRDVGKPRLPIDRVFTISGSGTVVTGTLIDGPLAPGQEIEIAPPGLKSRIRGLQTHKTQLNRVGPGNRVAVNLVGLSSDDLKRGYVLTNPGWLTPTEAVDARLRLLAQPERPLRHNTEVSLHTGSAEVMARVRLLEKEEVQPGETTWVQFLLEEPLACVNGDHFIIRSPIDTLGGGIMVEVHPKERHRRFRPETLENLKAKGEGKTEETVLATLKSKQPQELQSFLSQSNLAPDVARAALENLMEQGKVVALGDGKNSLLFTDGGWEQIAANAQAVVRDYHRRFPLRPGIAKAEISSKVKLGSHFQDALQLLYRKALLMEETGLVRLPEHQIKLTPGQQNALELFLKQLGQNPYSPVIDPEPEPDLVNLLVERGQAVRTAAGVVFSRAAYDEMAGKVMEHIKKNGTITVAEVRDMFHSSRKYVLALLEHLDEKKLTKRVGDERVAGTSALP